MFKSLIDNFAPALFGNSEAKELLRTLLLVQKELDKAEQRTINVEARLDELHEELEVSTQQNEQSLLEENQQLKNTAEELRQEIEASRGKIVRLEEEFKVELQKNQTELKNVMRGASEAACAQEEKLKASLEEELRNCKEELKEAVTQLQHHDDERRQLQLNAKQYESKIGEMLLENSALKGELASALEKMESLQPDKLKAQLQKILGDMEVMANELMQRKKVYEQDVEQARAERDEARHELDECKQQVQSLEQSLQNYKKAGHILAQDVVDFSAGLMQSVTTPRHQPTSDGDC